MNLTGHSDTAVLVIDGMLNIVNEDVPELFSEVYTTVRREVQEERQRRSRPSTSIYDPVEQAVSQRFNYEGVTDLEVRFWYALGAEIADYSCLGRGVRDHVKAVWLQSQDELKKRGIELAFFCDL